jgi:hypothetical protein
VQITLANGNRVEAETVKIAKKVGDKIESAHESAVNEDKEED